MPPSPSTTRQILSPYQNFLGTQYWGVQYQSTPPPIASFSSGGVTYNSLLPTFDKNANLYTPDTSGGTLFAYFQNTPTRLPAIPSGRRSLPPLVLGILPVAYAGAGATLCTGAYCPLTVVHDQAKDKGSFLNLNTFDEKGKVLDTAISAATEGFSRIQINYNSQRANKVVNAVIGVNMLTSYDNLILTSNVAGSQGFVGYDKITDDGVYVNYDYSISNNPTPQATFTWWISVGFPYLSSKTGDIQNQYQPGTIAATVAPTSSLVVVHHYHHFV